MMGQRISDFIKQLHEIIFLAPYDQTFLQKFDAKFPSLSSDTLLTITELQWIQQVFAERWVFVDYTRNQDASDQHWIQLAHDLAVDAKKSYLWILMPTITNDIDPNNFSKLADCKNLSAFFLSDDKSTLYCLNGLHDKLHKPQAFGTYNNDRTYTLRALSVNELWQVRSKNGLFPFQVSDKNFADLFDYLTKKKFPEWHKYGELPKQLLPSLLKLVDHYFSEKNKQTFPRKFLQHFSEWIKSLQECSVDDVHCLYGQTIHVGPHAHFLINILMDCLQCDHSDMTPKVVGIARWLCKYDATLIASSPDLNTLYTTLSMGPGFHLAHLQHCLAQLPANNTVMQRMITLLSQSLIGKSDIDHAVITRLGFIYSQRWEIVRDTAEDYTRCEEGPWTHLARLLRGAGKIDNEYAFLIPTLVELTDPGTRSSITDFPLTHYVVSQSGDRLIYLGNCKTHAKICGTFNNCNTIPPSSLSATELIRLEYANKKFSLFTNFAKHGPADEYVIPRRTVLALYDLVNESFYPKGLIFGVNYTEEQLIAAENAYKVFDIFFHELPKIEQEQLLKQRIRLNGKNLSLKSILGDRLKFNCYASSGEYLAQLVMDYAPHLRFSSCIEEWKTELMSVDVMRKNSQKKIVSDYNWLDNLEAKRRIKILAASLMSYNFGTSQVNSAYSIWDCINPMEEKAMKIHGLLIPIINSGNFTSARYVYATIMESIVSPALDGRQLSWFSRPNGTQYWLQSCADDTIFTKDTSWFNPAFLLVMLVRYPKAVDLATTRLLQDFLDELARTYVQRQPFLLKEIRINIKFIQLLTSLGELPRNQLLRHLKSSNERINPEEFNVSFADYLMSRIALLGASITGQDRLSFHKNGYSPRRITDIKDHLKARVSFDTGKIQDLLEKLIVEVKGMLPRMCSEQAKSEIKRYLLRIKNPIFPLVSTVQVSNPSTLLSFR